jgi:pimeloyl-ACP methyl ester carboxylesterase
MRSVIALTCLTVLGACTRERAPELERGETAATPEIQSGAVNVGDATLRYEVSGQGTPLVLIHGWAQDLSIWDDQVREFSPQYRVLRYTRRGYGQSTGHADPTADPDDLRILLDSLGVQSAHVLGLSAGSETALSFAVAFPERVSALVLYGQPPPQGYAPMPPGPPPLVAFAEMARNHGVDSVRNTVLAHPLAWTPPEKPELRGMLRQMMASYDGRDLLDPRPPSGRVTPARMDQLAQIRVPTLVITGDHEMPFFLQVADTIAARIPGARRVTIGNAGHGAHFAQPEQFNSAVRQFLDEAGQRRAR